jgi:radical SAM superfamily enzyme YgiQ (UPF0313 family)
VRVLLVSTYELGRQPFGLASPAAWLRAEGHEVAQADVSRAPLSPEAVREAGLVAFFLPMHTATRLSLPLIERVRRANPQAHLCAYGLYAPLNAPLLGEAGVETILGGEFEPALRALARDLDAGRKPPPGAAVSLARQRFLVPDRTGLPPLSAYAQLAVNGSRRIAGYTEASRGCKHLCRHCPVVPVYRGAFRVVEREVVLEDIRRQVAAGARHITFGDPDFLNGPGHAIPLVESLHREWPDLSYDATIKVEHLLQHRRLLPVLKATGCVLVTSAVESFDDAVLEKLAKGHTRARFEKALRLTRAAGLPLAPTFIPFTPWTTRESYRKFLRALVDLDLAEDVAPIQLAIRLLIPEGSLLIELPEIRGLLGPFDPDSLCFPWRSPDPWLDVLFGSVQETVKKAGHQTAERVEIFRKTWELTEAGHYLVRPMISRSTIPYLTEPWYC